jgi:hypothetical protein
MLREIKANGSPDQFLNLMLDPFVDGPSGIGGADHPALGFVPIAMAL